MHEVGMKLERWPVSGLRAGDVRQWALGPAQGLRGHWFCVLKQDTSWNLMDTDRPEQEILTIQHAAALIRSSTRFAVVSI